MIYSFNVRTTNTINSNVSKLLASLNNVNLGAVTLTSYVTGANCSPNSFEAWHQVIASTSTDIAAIAVIVTSSAGDAFSCAFQVGVGTSGHEVPVTFTGAAPVNAIPGAGIGQCQPIAVIPAGSRVSVRGLGLSSNNNGSATLALAYIPQ